MRAGSRMRAVGMTLAVAVTGVLGVGSPARAAPSTWNGHAYVWANTAESTVGTPYTPSLDYQYNSSGALNTVTRTGTGTYTVRFPYLGPYGTALVSAYGATDDRCKIGGWTGVPGAPSFTDTVLTVRCYTRLGAPANSLFTASYTYPGTGTGRAAYLWNDQPSSDIGTTITPSLTYQYNSTGSPSTIIRVDTGSYAVRLTGLALPIDPPRQLLVTAYGAPANDPSAYCAMDSSPVPDPSDGVYYVSCFNTAGNRMDSMFVLTYVESGNHLLAPTASRPTANVGVGCGPPAATSCLSPSWPFDTDPVGSITVTPLGSGEYAIQLPMPLANGNVQVSGYYLGDANRGRCKVSFWNPTDGVRVRCVDLNGAVPDFATFVVSFVR